MVVPGVTVPAILDLCFPAGLCSIKGLEIEGLESQRKTELLQITRLCGLLLEVLCWLARMGSSLIHPVLSSTPLDWICNMNSGLLVCSCGMSY